MDITTLKYFFLWCTIINFAMLIFMSLMCMCAKDWIYSIHSKFFPISKEAFNIALYSFIGFFKVLFIVFNLVPLIALGIVA